MKEKYKNKTIVMTILAILILFISIVYTLVSSNVKKDYKGSGESASIWNVGFIENNEVGTNDNQNEVTVIDNNPNTIEKSSCGSVKLNFSAFTITDAVSIKPGSKCIYKLNIKNSGQIMAKLSNITMTSPDNISCQKISESCFQCEELTYRLSNDSHGYYDVTIGDTITTGNIKTMYLIVVNQSNGNNSTPIVQKNAKFTLIYNQA